MAMEQRRIVFSGTVQGVGFRYAACRIAAHYEIRGTVQNLSDGRVECVVEGLPAEIDAFGAELGEAMSDYIREVSQQTAPYTGKLPRFTVKH